MQFNCLQQRMDVDLIAELTSTTADAWPGWEMWDGDEQQGDDKIYKI